MAPKQVFLGLDVGTKRIGVATADSLTRVARPLNTIQADQNMARAVHAYIKDLGVTDIVVGLPRNQAGDTTAQTAAVQKFVKDAIAGTGVFEVHWQDESLTSVIAEERLIARKKPYSKLDVDAEAAAIILQDYLEATWTA